jgi:hypothetical protein
MPTALLALQLCRDVYHCTPQALAAIPLQTVADHLIVLQVEGEVARLRSRR